MPLSLQDDPDRQIPMPFAAADDYARQVMAWSRDTLVSGSVAHLNIEYGPHRLHRYDVFSPASVLNAPKTNAPVLVFWHGGGWTNGYRAYNHFLARQALALGCVLVTPSYRLVTEAKFPAAFDDALAALKHITDHIQVYGGCGHKLFLAGHSAGGHLAALVALRVADQLRVGLGQARGQGQSQTPSPIRACLPISGIMDLHHPSPAAGSLEERVYAMVLSHRDQDAVMSPVNWAAGNRVPFVLTWGEKDSERVHRSNQRLYAMLQLQAAPVSQLQMSGHDHFQTHTSLAADSLTSLSPNSLSAAPSQHPWWAALQNQIRLHT